MAETKYSGVVVCSHCGNKGYMKKCGLVTDYKHLSQESDTGGYIEWDEGDFWEILKCPACELETIRKGFHHDLVDLPDLPARVNIYPQSTSSKDWTFLPPDILKAVQAAHSVKAIESNAYGVLLGRVLDLICIDKQAKGEKLVEKINDLAERHILPGHLKDLSHNLRIFRNLGAHADAGNLTTQETELLSHLCDSLLEYLYKGPFILEQAVKQIGRLKTEKNPVTSKK